MKFTAITLGVIALFSTVQGHAFMAYPPPRGLSDVELPFYVGDGSKHTYPCNGYGVGKTTTALKAGQTVNTFFTSIDVKKYAKYTGGWPPKKPLPKSHKLSIARHGGGRCEYSLSYDGGKTFYVFGRYTVTCPDIYNYWPVKIPKNAKSCTTHGKCLFHWTWTSTNIGQFYSNCADVTIKGVSGGVVGKTHPVVVDVKGYPGYNSKDHAAGKIVVKGDKTTYGPGPMKGEITANSVGKWL